MQGRVARARADSRHNTPSARPRVGLDTRTARRRRRVRTDAVISVQFAPAATLLPGLGLALKRQDAEQFQVFTAEC